MSTVIKQTTKQAKAAYRKNGGRPSEREVQRLENLAAADRRAEELREKERKRKENRKKREEKEKKEREARRKNGLGDATQACGWNFTQHRQKNWFRSFLQKNNPPPPKNPYRSSPIQLLGEADDERYKSGGDGLPEQQHHLGPDVHPSAPSPADPPSSPSEGHNEDGGVFVDTCEHLFEESKLASRREPACASQPQEDGTNDEELIGACHGGVEQGGSAGDCNTDLMSSPWEEDHTDDNLLLKAYDQVVDETKSVTEVAHHEEAVTDEEDEPWDLETIDEAALLDAVQGKTPVSKASGRTQTTQLACDDDGLPSMNAALNTELTRSLPTSHSPFGHSACAGHFSDSFMSSSSDFDITAEDLAEVDALCLRQPTTPSKSASVTSNNASLSRARPASLMPPPSTPMRKRKLGISEKDGLSAVKQQKVLMSKHTSTLNSMPPPPKPAGSPQRSRFADFGLSTQLLADAADEDDIDF